MAKKSKTKKEDKPEEPKLTERETARLAIVKAQATPDETDAMWEEFATDIEATSNGLKEVMMHGLSGALALGAKVIEFAKRPEIQKQVELYNFDKKGQDIKDFNFVAAELESNYSGMPTAKHLGDCARGYIKAEASGQLKGGKVTLRSLLGWTPSNVPAITGKTLVDGVNPAGQIPTGPKKKKVPKVPKDKKDIDPRAELITALHDANESIQYWADQCKEKELDTAVAPVQEESAALMQTLETL